MAQPETELSAVRMLGARRHLTASGKPDQQAVDDDRQADRADHPLGRRILALGEFLVPLGHVRAKTFKRGVDVRFQGFHVAHEQFEFEASNGFDIVYHDWRVLMS